MYDQNNRKCRCGKQGRGSKIDHFGKKKMPIERLLSVSLRGERERFGGRKVFFHRNLCGNKLN